MLPAFIPTLVNGVNQVVSTTSQAQHYVGQAKGFFGKVTGIISGIFGSGPSQWQIALGKFQSLTSQMVNEGFVFDTTKVLQYMVSNGGGTFVPPNTIKPKGVNGFVQVRKNIVMLTSQLMLLYHPSALPSQAVLDMITMYPSIWVPTAGGGTSKPPIQSVPNNTTVPSGTVVKGAPALVIPPALILTVAIAILSYFLKQR